MIIYKSINELFGMDKESKQDLSNIEFSYDKKFNAFCLTISSFTPEKLQNTLSKKEEELSNAKQEKKSADGRYNKLAAQIKIDYLENVCNKCKSMIKKKQSFNK